MKQKTDWPGVFIIYCGILIVVMLFFNIRGVTYASLLTSNNDQAQKSANHFHK